MKNLNEIVDYYEYLKLLDLYPESGYSDAALHLVKKYIDEKNKDFFCLVEKSSYKKDFNSKGLEIILNKLTNIYHDLSFDLSEHSIRRFENTPLFKFEIRFDNSLLAAVFSQMAIIDGISSIYWYLKEHFQDEMKFGDELRGYRYTPAYVDEFGYARHIYSKFMSNNFLSEELYNHKKYWIKKIDEFLNYLPSAICVCLPISYSVETLNKTVRGRVKANQPNSDDSLLARLRAPKDYSRSIIFPEEAFEHRSSRDNSEKISKILVFEEFEKLGKMENPNRTKVKPKPFFQLESRFVKENSAIDYTKDLYISLRDVFKLISKDTKLSNFRLLFSKCVISDKIETSDSKKLIAVIKFLKSENVIAPHHNYILKMTSCFIEPNQKEITVLALRGSKKKLTYKEEKSLKHLFGIVKSEAKK